MCKFTPLLTLILLFGVPAVTRPALADEAEKEDEDDESFFSFGSSGDDDKSDSAPSRAINFPGTLGLGGMQDMVDARTPEDFIALRAGVRYSVLVEEQSFDGALDVTRERERHAATFYAGGSLLGLVDVSIRIPFVYDKEDRSINGFPDPAADYDKGWGNISLAGKVTLKLGPVEVAPYLHGLFPTGEPAVEDLAELEYGVAGSFFLLNDYLGVHGNLAGIQIEGGISALRYRVGASFVVWSTRPLLLRVYGYGDGIEFEGGADSDIDIEFGVQALLFRVITVEIGASVRLLDAGRLDDTVKDDLAQDLGVLDEHFDDEGTWALTFGAGIAF
jgi:hypothetical protein